MAVPLILAIGLALGGSPANAGSRSQAPSSLVPWLQFHGDPASRGFNRAEHQVDPSNVSSLSLKWIGNGASSNEDLVYRSSPVVANGLVYFGTDQGQVLAFKAAGCGNSSCQPQWRVDLPQGIYNTPAISGNRLFVGTSSRLGKFYALDASSGAMLWTSPLSVGDSSPKVANGTVYVGSAGASGGLYAFDSNGCGQSTCAPLWVGTTGAAVGSTPAVAGGFVYVGAQDGYLDVFDAAGCGGATCLPVWRGKTGSLIFASSPAVAQGQVFQPSFDGRLNVFSAAGCGQAVCLPRWKGDLEAYGDSSPAVANGFVYIGHHEGWMAVFRTSGCGQSLCQPNWYGMAAGQVAENDSPPMIANGVAYIGSMVDRVYAYPAAGCGHTFCDPLWEFVTQDPIVNSSPLMDGGTLYVSGTNFGSVPELYVFRPFLPSVGLGRNEGEVAISWLESP
jgi:outer membrane protein assembly factor BamB